MRKSVLADGIDCLRKGRGRRAVSAPRATLESAAPTWSEPPPPTFLCLRLAKQSSWRRRSESNRFPRH